MQDLSAGEVHMPGLVGPIGNPRKIPICLVASPGLISTGKWAFVKDLTCYVCKAYALQEEYSEDDKAAIVFVFGS